MKRSMGGVENGDLTEIQKRVNLKVFGWKKNYLLFMQHLFLRRALWQLWRKEQLQFHLEKPKTKWSQKLLFPLSPLSLHSKLTNFLNTGRRQVSLTSGYLELANKFIIQTDHLSSKVNITVDPATFLSTLQVNSSSIKYSFTFFNWFN